MTASIITVIAVVAGIAWLGMLFVSAIRNRGGEEVSSNVRPGITDEEMETRRLENGQKAAIAFSAFLAISLPLYFLGEPQRQEGFVEEFSEASIERGGDLVVEFACFSCHGPEGSGGVATYVEKRSGVTVSWAAPSLNDVFARYDEDEVNFWVTYGRGNTPMPAWGLPGGGPLNEEQVVDVVNYLQTIQIGQGERLGEVEPAITAALSTLANADSTVAAAILEQRQVVAEIEAAPADAMLVAPLAERAGEVLDDAGEGLDTDGDGVSDAAETTLSGISTEVVEGLRILEPIELDPETSDAELVDQALAELEAATEANPIVQVQIDAIEAAIEANDLSEEGSDPDDDGLSTETEETVTTQIAAAITATLPAEVQQIALDPTNPTSVGGEPDLTTATRFVGNLESLATTLSVTETNQQRLLEAENVGLEFLVAAQEQQAWAIDFEGVAETMGVSVEEAQRAVGLFNSNCARCHTAGYSAGIPFTLEAGSGGFGPALWDGRPLVQFGPPTDEVEDDLLIQFLINGSEAATPYGLNGFGSGRMPAFGANLGLEDIELLAHYLRSGNLDGSEGEVDVLP